MAKPANVVEGREFRLFQEFGQVKAGQKVGWLVRRLARAEAALEIVPGWTKAREKEWQDAWDAWEASKVLPGVKKESADATEA